MTTRSVKAAEAAVVKEIGELAAHIKLKQLDAVVRARCIGCGSERDIAANEVPEGEHPVCSACGMPMIAVSAALRAKKAKARAP